MINKPQYANLRFCFFKVINKNINIEGEEMTLKKIFNNTLLLFCIIVPLISIKVKVSFIPLSPDFIIGGILIFEGVLILIQTKKRKENFIEILNNKSLKFLTIFVLIFTLIAFGSIIYANNKGAAIAEGIRFLEYILIFYFTIIIVDGVTIKKAFKLFYISMIIASSYGVLQYLFNLSEFPVGGFWGRGRVYATFVNPNYWGAAINMVIFYPLINILEKKKIVNNLLVFILFFFNLFFTSTRGSWIGFGIGLLVIGIIKYKKLVIYSLGLFLAMVVLPITRNRFLEMLNISERFTLWKTGFYMFKDHLLLGVGNGNYIFEYKNYVKNIHKELFLGRSKFSVHNSYLKMFLELGIFGGLAFIMVYLSLFNLVYMVYKHSKKYKKYALAFLGFGISYLLQNLSNNLAFIPQLNIFPWLIVALLYKGLYIEQKMQ